MAQLFANQKWRWIGLIPILFWVYNLVINLTLASARFGPETAGSAWQYCFFACPMACLVIGIGILLNNRFLTGAGALWGIAPVFLMDILQITPAQAELAAAQQFSIPFIKYTAEFTPYITEWIGSTGVVLTLIEEFSTHWLGNFIFGIIGLILVGLSRWSFIGTSALFLFTAFFTKYVCPFAPPSPEGAPSLLIQAIPLTIIWLILNYSIYGLRYKKEKNEKILFIILTLYFAMAVAIFSYLETIIKSGPILLLLGYFIILALGKIAINKKAFLDFFKRYNQRKNKIAVYISYGYAVLFLLFYIFMMLPELSKEGEGILMPFILFGIIPFAILFAIGFYLIPKLRK